jgi:dihydropteroate synthase
VTLPVTATLGASGRYPAQEKTPSAAGAVVLAYTGRGPDLARSMIEHLLFVTGKLAEKSLRRVLASIEEREFTYEIRVLGVSVAALLTAAMIRRRLGAVDGFHRVILPGRCRGDLDGLAAHFGVPFERGPEELKDLPAFFGTQARPRNLDRTDVTLFVEVVDAPQLDVDAILDRARQFRADGADVIDLGCLPDTPFAHLEDAIGNLKQEGFKVSIDSLDAEELRRGAAAGADFAFSLTAETLDIVAGHACAPILIAEDPADLDALCRTIETFQKLDRPFYADPVLDPIHHGFNASLGRYKMLRERFPDIGIMMGIGNLSELTHTDSLGLNTLLMGVVSELGVTGVLTTAVSAHCRTAIRELDRGSQVRLTQGQYAAASYRRIAARLA